MNYRKNKKIFITLSILILISLFGVAAVCNLCGTDTEATATDTTSEEETTAAGATTATDATTATTAGSTSTTDTAADTTAGEPEAPTIKLSIYEGPTYAEDSGVCYYRIKAAITGNPTPNVKFSKDDSGGTLSKTKCQVNINNPGDTYTLTAVAINSVDEASDTLELSWGCEVENQDPVISEITLMGTKYTNIQYTISTAASDPDGDSLTYKWVITNPRGDPNGTISDDSVSAMKWTTPPTPGEYKIEVFVDDGKGGEANAYEIVDVHFFYDLLAKAPSAKWKSIGGNDLWNVGLGDSRGFACYRTNITLEDNNTYSKVLETHPHWINNGNIGGEYPDIIKIPEGARFTASVGFIKDATGTDGVGFVVVFRDTSSVVHHITSVSGYHATYNGALDSLNLDLSSFAGLSGVIILLVNAGASSDQDWAVWVDPQIIN